MLPLSRKVRVVIPHTTSHRDTTETPDQLPRLFRIIFLSVGYPPIGYRAPLGFAVGEQERW